MPKGALHLGLGFNGDNMFCSKTQHCAPGCAVGIVKTFSILRI